MAGYERKVHRLLKDAEFKPERNPRGSHVIWSNGKFAVSVPAKIRSRHTANKILKEVGIRERV